MMALWLARSSTLPGVNLYFWHTELKAPPIGRGTAVSQTPWCAGPPPGQRHGIRKSRESGRLVASYSAAMRQALKDEAFRVCVGSRKRKGFITQHETNGVYSGSIYNH